MNTEDLFPRMVCVAIRSDEYSQQSRILSPYISLDSVNCLNQLSVSKS